MGLVSSGSFCIIALHVPSQRVLPHHSHTLRQSLVDNVIFIEKLEIPLLDTFEQVGIENANFGT
jgi:hypothetical protein